MASDAIKQDPDIPEEFGGLYSFALVQLRGRPDSLIVMRIIDYTKELAEKIMSEKYDCPAQVIDVIHGISKEVAALLEIKYELLARTTKLNRELLLQTLTTPEAN